MFITRSKTEVYNDISDSLISGSVLNKAKSPGAKVRALTTAMVNEFGEVYSNLNTGMLMTLVSTSTGLFLDYLAEIFNLRRIRSGGAHIASEHKVFKYYVLDGTTFGAINSGSDIVVPKGTKLNSIASSTKAVSYELDDTYTLDKDATEMWVGANSLGNGSRFNVGAGVICTHSFTGYTDVASDMLQVINMSGITTATDTESDSQFRYRIIKQATSGEKANETAIRLALLSVPGVANVYFDEFGYGIGTFVAYIQPTIMSAGDDLLGQCRIVAGVVKAKGVAPIITYLKRIGIEMELSITFTSNTSALEKTNLLSAIRLNVMNYLANLTKDQPFIVNEVVQRVMQTSANILNVGAANKPIDRLWAWKDNFADDTRYRQTLTADLYPNFDEIITYEYTIDTPIRVVEKK